MLTGRVVGPGEPRWLPEDLDIVLAYREYERERCPQCGTFGWEWTSDHEAYEPWIRHCHGCVLIDEAREMAADLPGSVRPGAHPTLKRPDREAIG